MKLPRYELQATTDRLQFEFVSIGRKGAIIKRIEFTYVDELAFWNLGFGDYNPITNRIDDQAVSDNGDGRKVLATVAFAVSQFLGKQPDATVFFTGSTDQRTRVYGWAVANYWLDIQADFHIQAVLESGDVVMFDSQENLIGFLVTKK
jgi:hypothetical protein